VDFFSDAGSIPAISTIKSPNATAFGLFPFSLFTFHFSLAVGACVKVCRCL